MSLTLYHYVHCPFCVRVRMAFGFLDVKYDSQVLAYDDKQTPLALTGKKMLPILSFDQGTMNESLDIINYADQSQKLKVKEVTSSDKYPSFEDHLNQLSSIVHSLAMPYWIYTPEFNESSRQYFQTQKEVKRGPFKDLVKNQETFKKQIQPLLNKTEAVLMPFYESKEVGLLDILLASHLWGLYVVPEFQFSERMHAYLQSVKSLCHFNYHQHLWS